MNILDTVDQERIGLKTIRYHNEPFYNECRAYGRLIKDGQNGLFAVKCHGYVLISSETKRNLDELFPEIEFGEEQKYYPAIVKDFIEMGDCEAKLQEQSMAGMNKAQIMVRKMERSNFTQTGLFYSLGRSETLPNVMHDVRPPHEQEAALREDSVALQKRITEEGFTSM